MNFDSRAVRRVLAAVAAVLVGVGALLGIDLSGDSGSSAGSDTGSSVVDTRGSDADRSRSGVPDRAWQTLDHIDAGDWPDAAEAPGTRGGDVFRNREGRLPDHGDDGARIGYREWDVNPKEPNRGRDAERIVTGDDDSAWYTGDHYDSFTRMR